ncbi:MAG TPA: DEAD/DEAH box helicase, partial [Candidatus Saccharimonadales bacterium]|nr:DEAD/DEAH box helicase [Candidatus Saccharimonadales bacterium]
GKQTEDVQAPTKVTNIFSNYFLHPTLVSNVAYKGYTIPTPIQDKVIPEILDGKDVIGIANTGTGKTAAFLIPLIQKTIIQKMERTLIVAPTRELAFQIYDELKSLSKGLGITASIIIGGVGMGRQIGELRNNPNFVIGTPGRMKDLILEKALFLGHFHNVVLDEADRMVDIGFIRDIQYFISLLPQNRQSLFFSATIGGKVNDVLHGFVNKNAVTASVVQQQTAENIKQDVIHVGRQQKIDVLHNLLTEEGFDKVMIFGRTKWGVQKLADELQRRGFRVGAIHGNKNQNQRQRVLESFKRGDVKILLATDVASRGLDISDVTHVINYDMPASMDDYVHRIGRTGRAEKTGIALTFVE